MVFCPNCNRYVNYTQEREEVLGEWRLLYISCGFCQKPIHSRTTAVPRVGPERDGDAPSHRLEVEDNA